MTPRRLAGALFGLAIGALAFLGVIRWGLPPLPTSLQQLQERAHDLQAWRDRSPGEALAAYSALYFVICVISLPAAALMTTAGGALFGWLTATIVVSFVSTLGNCLAFVIARYFLRDWVRAKLGPRLERIERGVKREGGFYLFALRMTPVVPSFVINFGMSVTPIRLRAFYIGTQLGTLPITILYTAAGRELAQMQSLRDVLSPGLIAALVGLGVLPLVARRAQARWLSA